MKVLWYKRTKTFQDVMFLENVGLSKDLKNNNNNLYNSLCNLLPSRHLLPGANAKIFQRSSVFIKRTTSQSRLEHPPYTSRVRGSSPSGALRVRSLRVLPVLRGSPPGPNTCMVG